MDFNLKYKNGILIDETIVADIKEKLDEYEITDEDIHKLIKKINYNDEHYQFVYNLGLFIGSVMQKEYSKYEIKKIKRKISNAIDIIIKGV
jgi:hypothetical membrane protein